MGKAIVITGTPGTGKSTVSNLLASQLNYAYINIGNLVKQKGLSCGFDEKRETLIADTPRIAKVTKEFLAHSEDDVIIDGHLAVDVVSPEDTSLVVVLRRNPNQLREILGKRGFKDSKISENVAAEVLDVCLYDAVKAYGEQMICEIDVSEKTLEEAAEQIVRVIKSKEKGNIGVVDWLTYLDLKDQLDSLLDSLDRA